MRFSWLLLLHSWVAITTITFSCVHALTEREFLDDNSNNDDNLIAFIPASDVTTNSEQQISAVALNSPLSLLDQNIASSNFDLFLNDDNAESAAQLTELDLFAGGGDHDDVYCDVGSSSADDPLLGKHRRRRRRRGEGNGQCRSEPGSASSLEDLFDRSTTDMFPSEAEGVCPPRIFGLSNILVCSNPRTQFVRIAGELHTALLDVDPRTYIRACGSTSLSLSLSFFLSLIS